MPKLLPPILCRGQTSLSFVGYLSLIILGVVVLILLQNQYWNGEFGYYQTATLVQEVRKQERINAEQHQKNTILYADVEDLKSGLSAIEEHARLDLGLIKSGETFVQLSTASVSYLGEQAVGVDAVPPALEPVDVFDESE